MYSLNSLFDPSLLAQCISDRLVNARRHPTLPLTILNYSEKCTYEPGNWNEVTLQCRGLIHDDDGNIIARPFRKFFNYGQEGCPKLDLCAEVTVTDKMDGSLGILYSDGAGYCIATRGSFVSEQAVKGTEMLRQQYGDFRPPGGWTVLFEIIYPENRIVVDYGDRSDLVLLGAVHMGTGASIDPDCSILSAWTGPRAVSFPYFTLADALAAEPRKNCEGLVVYFTESGERLKIKQADYVELHRIITGLSERTVWDWLVVNKPLHELVAMFPEEFTPWIETVAEGLNLRFEDIQADIEDAYIAIVGQLPGGFTQKDFALLAKEHALGSFLFSRHSGKDTSTAIWKMLYPPANTGPRGCIEELA